MSGKSTDKGGISWLGVGAIGVFYLLILIVGLGASWWKTRKSRNRENQAKNSQETSVIVADRSLGMVVGVFTLTGKMSLFRTRRLLANLQFSVP